MFTPQDFKSMFGHFPLWMKGLNNSFAHSILTLPGNCNLHCKSDFIILGINTVHNEKNWVGYFEPLRWNKVPSKIRRISDFNRFKAAIRKWKPSDCPWRLCKNYLGNVEFINVSWLKLIAIYFALNSLCIYISYIFHFK